MARWLVELEGDRFDLDEFPHWFPHGPVFAMTDDDGTFIVADVLESCNDVAAVHQRAECLHDEMHSVISLLEPDVRRPLIGKVLREDDAGQRTGTVHASATIGGRSKLRVTLSGGDDPLGVETQAQLLLSAAQTSRHLRIALSLLAMPHVSWPHLYRALEEIEVSLAKRASEVGICSANERERFTRSANSGEVAGKDARHRIQRFEPPPQPMTLHEATEFIRCCLYATLRRLASEA